MLPCIVANWSLVSSSLPRAIDRFLARPRKLIEIEREFSSGDPVLVRTAVFGMLHAGRLSAPDLHMQALSQSCRLFDYTFYVRRSASTCSWIERASLGRELGVFSKGQLSEYLCLISLFAEDEHAGKSRDNAV